MSYMLIHWGKKKKRKRMCKKCIKFPFLLFQEFDKRAECLGKKPQLQYKIYAKDTKIGFV